MHNEHISFSFGDNWKEYLKTVSRQAVDEAVRDIINWLGQDGVNGRSVVDIGSGSGIHSLAFHLLGAASVHSIDADPKSVEATSLIWSNAGNPANWKIEFGSILDSNLLARLPKFDIVYSWGVLHHTGQMWLAMANTASLLQPGGYMWISIYTKGPRYASDLELKRKFNHASGLGKRIMINRVIARRMWSRVKQFKNPFGWNVPKARGMNVYHDIVDWLGGLPYEVASVDEVESFGRQHGLMIERTVAKGEGACSIYLLKSTA